MKRFYFLAPVLFLLAACVLLSPAGPSTPTLPSGDLDRTIIAQTLTAWPTPVPATPTPTSTPTETSTATPTPVPPSPTAVPTSTAMPFIPVQSPDQFIRSYYYSINLGNYPLTWSLLSPNFRSALYGPAQGGFQGYVDSWDPVHNVLVDGVQVVFECYGCVVVNVATRYHYKNGTLAPRADTYILVYDYVRNTWLFEASLTFTSTPRPTAKHNPAPTRTRTPTRTFTSTFTPTFTPSPTFTFTGTSTGTATSTDTPSATPTDTPTPSDTSTDTPTPTAG